MLQLRLRLPKKHLGWPRWSWCEYLLCFISTTPWAKQSGSYDIDKQMSEKEFLKWNDMNGRGIRMPSCVVPLFVLIRLKKYDVSMLRHKQQTIDSNRLDFVYPWLTWSIVSGPRYIYHFRLISTSDPCTARSSTIDTPQHSINKILIKYQFDHSIAASFRNMS